MIQKSFESFKNPFSYSKVLLHKASESLGDLESSMSFIKDMLTDLIDEYTSLCSDPNVGITSFNRHRYDDFIFKYKDSKIEPDLNVIPKVNLSDVFSYEFSLFTKIYIKGSDLEGVNTQNLDYYKRDSIPSEISEFYQRLVSIVRYICNELNLVTMFRFNEGRFTRYQYTLTGRSLSGGQIPLDMNVIHDKTFPFPNYFYPSLAGSTLNIYAFNVCLVNPNDPKIVSNKI